MKKFIKLIYLIFTAFLFACSGISNQIIYENGKL
ncbi:hypothetical protein FUSO6_11240 [Fusobacterium necrophorum DAB]|nr:hypothetical protein FUSO6_11240 [Fusobacterium necrophorum DAB]